MPKLNNQEIKQILSIENRRKYLTELVDSAIDALAYIRADERIWWRTTVDKYHLNKKKIYRIWIDGEILEERRMAHAKRKIF